MTTATPNPNKNAQDAPQRPELHVVPDPAETAETVQVPAETEVETTGPVPVLDADGNPVTPQAPLDVRLREALLGFVGGVPAFGRVPASFADSIAYSQEGDWAVSEKSLKRVVHGLCTLVAYVGTYPLVEGLGKAREKPIGLVLVLFTVIALVSVMTSLL